MSTAESPTFRFPSDIYDFLLTPNVKIEALTRSHRGEMQPYVRLTREVVVGDEIGLRQVSESIHVFGDTLEVLDNALFLGIKEVEKGSPLETAQQNFFSVKAALRKASLPK